MARRTLLSWSTGKDSAFALHVLRESPDVDVVGLFTTVNSTHNRVAMHAVGIELLHLQAEAVRLPLRCLEIPYQCSNDTYEAVMNGFIVESKEQGVECMAFGDLFLEDIRDYREEKLQGTGIKPVFPLWQKPTDHLVKDMIGQGFRMITTCVDPRSVPKSLVGREIDESFLRELPVGVDPCGENGEFHTFVYDGPVFSNSLDVKPGKVVERDGLVFADVTLSGEDSHVVA